MMRRIARKMGEKHINRPLLVRTFSRLRPGSVRGSLFTMAAGCIGAGILSLPVVMKDCGLGFGMILLAAGGASAVMGLLLLTHCAEVTGLKSFSQLSERYGGKTARLALDWTIVVYCFGTIAAYFVVIASFLKSFMIGLGASDDSLLIHTEFLLPVMSYPVVLFLSFKRDLSKLRYFALMSVCSMIFVSVAVMTRGITSSIIVRGEDRNPYHLTEDSITWFNIDIGFFNSFTIIIFAYTCHVNVFPVFSELYNPSYRRMSKVLNRAIMTCFFLYCIVSFFGYCTFLKETKPNIIDAYDHEDLLFIIVRGAVSVTLSLNCPLTINPAIRILEMLIFGISPGKMNSQLEESTKKGNDNTDVNKHAAHTPSSRVTHSTFNYAAMENGEGNSDSKAMTNPAADGLSSSASFETFPSTSSTSSSPSQSHQTEAQIDRDSLDSAHLSTSSPLPSVYFRDKNLQDRQALAISDSWIYRAHGVRWCLLATTFTTSAMGLALAYPKIEVFFSLLGASCATIIAYILPVFLFFKIDPAPVTSFWKMFYLTVSVIISLISLTSIVITIRDIATGNNSS